MKISWIEKLAEEGKLSNEAKAKIYNSCNAFVKNAKESTTPLESLAMISNFLLTKNAYSLTHLLSESKKAILLNSNFLGKAEKVSARFNEIAKIAPNVAKDTKVCTRIIEKTLEKGLSSFDVQNLAMMEATTLSKQASLNKTPFQMQSQKIASAIRLGSMYADVILMTKEASKSKTVEKIFNSDRLWTALKTTAMISSIPLLAGVGTGAVQQAFSNKDDRDLKDTLKKSFTEAVNLDASSERPLLKDNIEKANDAFKTLVHFSPHVAADPSAARAFMSKIVGYDQGVDISSIKELTDIQRNIGQYGKKPGFSQGFAAGSKATGIDRVIGGSVAGALSPMQSDIGMAINPFNA